MTALPAKFRRALETAAAFASWKAADWAFDYLLYPFAIFRLGTAVGGATMALLSLGFCLAMLRIYDMTGRDWLGVGFVKGLERYEGRSPVLRLFASCLRNSKAAAFLFLSVRFDPFVTTAYLRRTQFGGMGRGEWALFLGSWAIGNATWTGICAGGLSAVETLLAPR